MLHELLHLNLLGALHYNALLTVLSPFVLAWLAWCGYQGLRYDCFPPIPWPRAIATVVLTMSLIFTLARNTGLAFAI